MLFEPVSGWLSDRFGRKPVMIIPGVLLLLCILPAFWVIAHYRTTLTFYALIALVHDPAGAVHAAGDRDADRAAAQARAIRRGGDGLCLRDLDLRRLDASSC